MSSQDIEGPQDVAESAEGENEDMDFEIAFYEAILEQVPNCEDVLMALSNNYTQRGLFEKGLGADQRLCQLRPQDPIIRYNLACSYSLLGQCDDALDTLQQAVCLGYTDLAFIQQDPDLEVVRRDPRYTSFLENLQLKQPKPTR
jgi:tetratricopeptide (TPR) repeat protein